jgi:predicted XRE-type DNA-binding protein
MGRIKLSFNDVIAIKKLVEETNLTHKEIAKIYGVSRGHITKIKNHKRWNYETSERQIENQTEEKYWRRAGLY